MTGGAGETAEDYAEDLVQKLNSLQNPDRAVAQLMACGAAAIPPVTRFLLLGKPGVVYQPRRAAVEILGAGPIHYGDYAPFGGLLPSGAYLSVRLGRPRGRRSG